LTYLSARRGRGQRCGLFASQPAGNGDATKTIGPRVSKPSSGMSPRPAQPRQANTPSSTATPSAGGLLRKAADTGKGHYRPSGWKRSKRCPVGSGRPRSTMAAGLQALKQFIDRHGQADPPREVRIGDYPVGNWVRAQRHAYERGRLPPERATELESLRGW